VGARGELAELSSPAAQITADDRPGEQITYGPWQGKHLNQVHQVGWCRLTASKPVLKAAMI
jgi:hypothetical protein